MPTGRQGNLIVSSTKTVDDKELRQMLIDEAKKQGKPYGLYFEDISSGFAVTTRRSPQAFQVIPLVVYRVFVDGKPDELPSARCLDCGHSAGCVEPYRRNRQ